MTKDEMVARLEKVTGIRLTAISGHKLCDFRPFFGLAFEDILKGHDFWGYCDLDMMFGDLGKLFTDDFLNALDVFSAHNSQLIGHFTILRNVEAVNRLGFQIESWRTLCLEPFTRALDEIRFSSVLEKNKFIRWQRPDSLAAELKRPFARFGITFGFFGQTAYLPPGEAPVVRWKEGQAHYLGAGGVTTEVLYVHFMGTKHWWHWLFWGKNSPSRPEHYFSRIGYGGVTSAGALRRLPWNAFYLLQRGLTHLKTTTGAGLRKILPSKLFVHVRQRVMAARR
jgi:hypothetical protein